MHRERMNEWNVRGKKDTYNLLELNVTSPIVYSFQFQIIVLESHRKTLEAIKTSNGTFHIMERCHLSCKNVFVREAVNKRYMSGSEEAIYEQLMNGLRIPDHMFYLNTPPDTCLRRIAERGRVEEKTITIDYLNSLHSYHQDWLMNEQIPVTVLQYDEEDSTTNLRKISDTYSV